MSIGIDFILRAKTEAFTRGMAAVNNSLKDTKKSLSEFDVGNGLKQALGVGGAIAAFRAAISNAQELRDEAQKLGKEVDSATQSVAEYGDVVDKVWKGAKNAATSALGVFTQVGDGIRQILQNTSQEEENAFRKIEAVTAKTAAAQEEQLRRSQAERSPEKMAAAEAKYREAQRSASEAAASDESKILWLYAKQADAKRKVEQAGTNELKVLEAKTELEKINADVAKETQRAKEKAVADGLKSQAETAKKVEEELTTFFDSVESGAKRIKETEEARVKVAKELAEQAEKEAAEKAKQLEVEMRLKELNDKSYADTVAAMSLSGLSSRDVQSASDATLQEIARRKQGNLTSLGAAGGSLAFDDNYFTRIQLQNEINQVKAELATRSNLRQSVAQQGIDGARRTFNGDPLVFDRLVQQFVQDSRSSQDLQAKTLSVLERMDQRQRSGLPVINVN